MSSLKVGGMYRVPWVTRAAHAMSDNPRNATKLNAGDSIVILNQELIQYKNTTDPKLDLLRFTVLCPSGVTGYIIIACSALFYWEEASLALSLSDASQTSP